MQPTKTLLQHSHRSLSAAATAVKPFSEIPGPKSVPPYGTYAEMTQQAYATSVNDVLNGYYKKYGSVMRHDMGPFPVVWLFDPELGRKMILNEGTYPRTAAIDMWPIKKYFAERKMHEGLTSSGKEWRDLRTLLQRDMFAPQVAESYLPNLDPVVKEISAIFPKVTDIPAAINFVSFDMFLAVIVGLTPRTTMSLVGGKVDPEDLQFVQDAITVMAKLLQAFAEPHVADHYVAFSGAYDRVIAKGRRYVRAAVESKIPTPVEAYLTRLAKRNELDDDGLDHALSQLLFAGVDTTATVLSILLLDLATNPEVQEKLYQEIKKELGDGPLTPENVRNMKYLNQVMRESHRLHPPTHINVMRQLYKEIELGGYMIPADTRILLCSTPISIDPAIVDSPEKFIPERWSPEAVAKRAGTSKEVLDHRLLQDPFGFGPRMCLGARVAKSEIKAFACQLVRDWKFEVPAGQKWSWVGFPGFSRAAPFPSFAWKARE